MDKERLNHQSSTIAETEYDYNNLTLNVKFNGGTVYEYANVPNEKYLNFKESESKGSFLAKEIKGTYEYRKIEDNEAN